jgi:hypothetical protein
MQLHEVHHDRFWRQLLRDLILGAAQDERGDALFQQGCKEIAFDVKAVERVGGRTVGRGNGGCSWKKGFALPVVNAYVFQNEMYQNDRGLYTVDTLRLFINYDDVIRFIPTLDSQPDTHLKDRVEYRGQIYAPNRVFPKGQINMDYTVLTVDLTQVKPEEIVNDIYQS